MDTMIKPFSSDIPELRRRAAEHLENGAVTANYGGDAKESVDILQTALASEIVCVLRYTMHAISATGLTSDGPKEEFAQHAAQEQQHMMQLAERINQLGGRPNFNPKGLAARAASQYGEAESVIEMIRENLVAERIAVAHYREMIGYFADKDPTTRALLEEILATEEEHASDMHDLLTAHQAK
jgi:bacterioferritin